MVPIRKVQTSPTSANFRPLQKDLRFHSDREPKIKSNQSMIPLPSTLTLAARPAPAGFFFINLRINALFAALPVGRTSAAILLCGCLHANRMSSPALHPYCQHHDCRFDQMKHIHLQVGLCNDYCCQVQAAERIMFKTEVVG